MKNKDNNEIGDIYTDLLQESGLNRVRDKIQNHAAGIVTAFRNDKSYKENMLNNKKILAYLQSKRYSITTVLGTFIEDFIDDDKREEILARRGGGDAYNPVEKHVNERSFFVVNDKVEGDDDGELAKDLYKMGKAFNQDSVLIIPAGGIGVYLWGTSDGEDAYPGLDVKQTVGEGKFGKHSGPFLSKVKGRDFAFEKERDFVFEEVGQPKTINGKRSQYLLLKEIQKIVDNLK
jgi:hypothetical protein